MEKQFVTYEIALKLKELSFDEPCLAYYDIEILFPIEQPLPDEFNTTKTNNIHYDDDFHYPLIKLEDDIIIAPLWSQVVDWFRDKHHTNIEINRFPNISKWGFVVTDMTIIPKQQTRKENINMSLKVADVRRFDEYFECREQAILKAIELCKSN